jgi:hypothetical protein
MGRYIDDPSGRYKGVTLKISGNILAAVFVVPLLVFFSSCNKSESKDDSDSSSGNELEVGKDGDEDVDEDGLSLDGATIDMGVVQAGTLALGTDLHLEHGFGFTTADDTVRPYGY